MFSGVTACSGVLFMLKARDLNEALDADGAGGEMFWMQFCGRTLSFFYCEGVRKVIMLKQKLICVSESTENRNQVNML